MKTRFAAVLAGAAMAVALIVPAAAALTYSFQGDAHVVTGGHPGNAAQLTSTPTTYGNVALAGFPTDPTAITTLSFDYSPDVTGASGGSPRLTVHFSDGGGADLRPLALVAGTWTTIDGMTGATWDNNGGTCGFVYDTTWTAVLACHAGTTITGMTVINDSGWMYPPAGTVVLVDNIRVNGDVITFDAAAGVTSKNDCKKGGWKAVVREDGTSFKNQGDCVSYTNNGK